MPNNDPDGDFARIRTRLDVLQEQFDTTAEKLKAAQHHLYVRAEQGFSVADLEKYRMEAVGLYEFFLDILIEQSVLGKRLME